MSDRSKPALDEDGIDQRGLLKCMAWAATGAIWTVCGGVLNSRSFGQMPHREASADGDFSFVRVSDSHIGFNKEANKDVTARFQGAVAKINALDATPDLIIHTGDSTLIPALASS